MRKTLIIFLLIGGLALGIGLFNNLFSSGDVEPKTLVASSSSTPVNIFSQSQPEIILEPASFSIPKLGVENVSVESVGLDKEGKMDIPKKETNVAWYNLGAKPGERGNAVVAGHYDNKDGSPSVFYEISKLKPGDELKTEAKDGKEYTFTVTKVQSYELAEFPLIEVFGAGDKPMLNLITCEGEFNKDSKLYSHRLVVYSELKP